MSKILHLKVKRSDDLPINYGKEWTPVDHVHLCQLYMREKPRLTWSSIAEKMGRTVPACQARMHLLWLAFSLSNSKSLHAALLGSTKRSHKAE